MKNTLTRLLLVFSVLLTASMACNLPKRGSDSLPTVVAMSPEEALQLEQRLKETLESSSGEVTIILTEQQINSFLAAKLAEQEEQILSTPVVKLTNGNMEVYGKLSQGAISLKMKIVLTPSIDASSNPNMLIQEMTMGGIPAPDEIKSQVANLINEAFQQYIANQSQGFKATKISIGEGTMSVTGKVLQP